MASHVTLLLLCCYVLSCGAAPTKKKEKKTPSLDLIELDPAWPSPGLRSAFGQIGGLAFDPLGNAVIFHRADRSWDFDDFNEKYSYVRAKYGAIEADTIVALDQQSEVLFSFGRGRFYLPHGLTVDNHGNVWVTDVALHQVLKFSPGKTVPSLSLGENLVPGSDDKHFCQPTAVAVATNGDFFVADGYCNSRVMKFNPNGTLIKKWGRKRKDKEPLASDHFSIPHGLALVEHRDLLCVADREHARVQCFTAGLKNAAEAGKFAFNVTSSEMGRPFGIAFSAKYDALFILAQTAVASRGHVFCLKRHRFTNTFDNPAYAGFGDGHALAASADGQSVLVGSLSSQCPDLKEPRCRLRSSALDQNLWRFELFSAQDKTQAYFPEEELQEMAVKRDRDMEEEETERWLRDWERRH